ncbi:MAG: hypothetical protein FJ100_14975 [Deltaproteobacteria bacterium]|nr:hypothetical protein [Deltaproteobacteria bacterium]
MHYATVGLAAFSALALLCSSSVAFAAPSTLAVEGALQSAGGGPAADGGFEFNVSLYASDTGGTAGWQEKALVAVVKDGLFRLTLGQIKPLDGKIVSENPYIGISVGQEPELPRRPLHSVAFALRAASAETVQCSGCIGVAQIDAKLLQGLVKQTDLSSYVLAAQLASVAQSGSYSDLKGTPDLSVFAKKADLADVAKTGVYGDLSGQPTLAKVGTACGTGLFVHGLNADGSLQCAAPLACKGCVGKDQLAADVAAAFLSTGGGVVKGALAVDGKLQLGKSAIEGGAFAAVDVTKAACDPSVAGQVVLDVTTKRLFLCDGAAFVRIMTCQAKCKAANQVPCGQPVVSDCGEAAGCSGVGTLCDSGAVCEAGTCKGYGQVPAAAGKSCKDILAKVQGAKDGLYYVNVGAGPVQVLCDMTSDGGAGYTLPTGFATDGNLIRYYDFAQKKNFDFKKNQHLSIADGFYNATKGLNLDKLGTGGAALPYAPNRTLVIKARREFGLSGTQGMVFSTNVGGQNDDGITIANDGIGTRTHGDGFQLLGAKVSSILPSTTSAKTFAMKIASNGATFYTGTVRLDPQDVGIGGNYDSCQVDAFVLGVNQFNYDPWDNGAFYIERLMVFNAELTDQQTQAYVQALDGF